MGAGASSAATRAVLEHVSTEALEGALKPIPAEAKEKLRQALLSSATTPTTGSNLQLPLGLQRLSTLANTHSFDSNRAVPASALTAILEATRSVPTSANTQPWTVLVVQGASRAQLAQKLLEKFDAKDDAKPKYLELPESMPPAMQEAVKDYQEQYYKKHLGFDPGDPTTRVAYRRNFDLWGAPVHLALCAPVGPCLKEEPPVEGVFLDMGSLMTTILMGAHDQSLGTYAHFSLSRYDAVYREALGKEQLPEDVFVVCGVSIGWPTDKRDPRQSSEFVASKLPVGKTTRWDSCDASWLSSGPSSGALGGGTHGLLNLVTSRHGSRSLDTSREVPREMISAILQAARAVPSAENSQPWRVTVVQGEARNKLSKAMLDWFDAGNDGSQTYKKYSSSNTPQMQKGKDIYGFELYEKRYGLARDDKDGRRLKYRPNYEYWGAPVLLLLTAPKGGVSGTFFDVGSFMYAILIGMHAFGLGGKPLGSVAKFTDTCREVLGVKGMPEDEHLICGICMGWPTGGRDPRETPDWFPSRLTLEETTRWICDADWRASS